MHRKHSLFQPKTVMTEELLGSSASKQPRKLSEVWNHLSEEVIDAHNVGVTEVKKDATTIAQQRRVSRRMSIENTALTEVITIYEKLKRYREPLHIRFDKSSSSTTKINIQSNDEADETVAIVPTFFSSSVRRSCQKYKSKCENQYRFLNFCSNIKETKYFYFSSFTNLIQVDKIENLGSPNFSELLKGKNYWLNICDPDEDDLELLSNSYRIHELTLRDVQEGNTEEKIEAYRHYTFFSLRLMCGDTTSATFNSSHNQFDFNESEDVNFNILLFKDFIITLHHKKWPGIGGILSFLNVMVTSTSAAISKALEPDWIIFSFFSEMNQDAKFVLDLIEPEVNRIQIGSKSTEMSGIMIRNFHMELRVCALSRFIKAKIRILRKLKIKCSKRIDAVVLKLLGDILKDLKEQTKSLKHFDHILERSQNTFLGIATAEESRGANEMNLAVTRLGEIALIFLPLQIASGVFGMNVSVPFQVEDYPSIMYFWIIITICFAFGLVFYFFRRRIFAFK